MPICDTVLRLADRELFEPHWTEAILVEVRDNLVSALGIAADKAAKRVARIRDFFPEAIIEPEYAAFTGLMTNDPGDRHVLAAAVFARVDQIVTFNVKHFPDDSVHPYAIEVRHPDEFLLNVLDLYPQVTVDVIRSQAADLSRPASALDDLIRKLAAQVPQFAQSLDTIFRTKGSAS
jgi:hypothetical protein